MNVRRAVLAMVFAAAAAAALAQGQETQPQRKKVDIEITEKGFTPATVTVEAGVAIDLVFTRRTDKTCATEVTVPSLKIKKELPLDQPTIVALTPEKGEIAFACGMNMLKGKLVVRGSHLDS